MNIKITTLLFLLLSNFSVVFSQNAPSNSLLWKISGNGLKEPSYLYGSLHIVCNEDIRLKPKLINALSQADMLLFECNYSGFDPYKDKSYTVSLPIPIGKFIFSIPIFEIPKDISSEDFMYQKTTLNEIMEPFKYEFVHNFFKDSLSINRGIKPYRTLHPFHTYSILLYTMLDCPVVSYEEVIGHKMADRILTYKGLETKDEYSALIHKDKSYAEHAENLYQLTNNYTSTKKEYKLLYKDKVKNYNEENLDYFDLNRDTTNLQSNQLYYFQVNPVWVTKIIKAIHKHKTVVVVGVSHLPANNGLLYLLQQKGYKVEPVYDL